MVAMGLLSVIFSSVTRGPELFFIGFSLGIFTVLGYNSYFENRDSKS